MASKAIDLEKLADAWEPKLRDAFLKAFQDNKTRVNLSALESLIEERNIPGVLRLLGLEPANFSSFALVHADAYNTAGQLTAASLGAVPQVNGPALHILFNVRNPRAERWVRNESLRLITEVLDDQKTGLRNFVERGLQRGANPRTTALDLVGRIGKATGKRTGGVVGLHSQQIGWFENYSADSASSDPAVLRRLLDRKLRDKRFDRTILKAIKEETGLPADIRSKMQVAYSNNALRYRGEMIARSETMPALGAAQTEAYQQGIDDGKLQQDTITRFPVDAGDGRVRKTHAEAAVMNKDGVGWNEPFQTPMGPKMHAPYEGEVNCRCWERIRIDFFRQ